MADEFNEADIVRNSKAEPRRDDLTRSQIVVNVKAPKTSDSQLKSINKKLADMKKQSKREKLQGTVRNIGKVTSAVIESFGPQKMTREEVARANAVRRAKARMEAIQRAGVMREAEFDNKFERHLVSERLKIDAEERKRRFGELPEDFEIRRAMIKDLQRQREFEYTQRQNMLRIHRKGIKVRLNLLNVDEHTNLMNTPKIWREDNPDNNIFQDNGRPTILDTPNRFAVTPESRRWNVLNAEKLNWGKVDVTRKPRKYREPQEDDYGTSQGQF
jgi:hypothetical protein